jgi:acetyl esterase
VPSVDPKTKPLLDLIAALGEPPLREQTILDFRERRRRGRELINTPPPTLAVIRDVEIRGGDGPIAARVYDDVDGRDRPTLVYFHGGGFVYGDLDSHDGICRRLAKAGGLRVVAVDYRLAPEHPFPRPVEDALAAFRDVAAHPQRFGADPARLAIGGDSAGACLSTIVARDVARRRDAALRHQTLFYPVTQQGRVTRSRERFAEGYFLTREGIDWFTDLYLGRTWTGVSDERISPLDFDVPEGLAPAFVITAGLDPLLDEGAAYAAKLKQAGVAVRYADYPDQIHGFLSFTAFSSVAEEVLADAGREIARALA